jgi:predicted DCC family thiol-disulfide oxidoreductase YuxK
LIRSSILYDDDCGFCRASTALALLWDRGRRLRPVAIQSAEGRRLLPGMPEAERLASWHLVDGRGEVHSAGAAFPPLLRLLPAGKPLAALSERLPGASERGYRFVAGHRSPLGRALPAALERRADDLIARRS